MADAYLIAIRLDRLAANFSKADGKTSTAADARAGVVEHGFLSTLDGWVCEDVQLGLLGRGEYRIIRQTT